MGGLEAKSASKVQDAHLKGLRAIAPQAGLLRRVVVCTGERAQRTPDGIDLWPVLMLGELFPARIDFVEIEEIDNPFFEEEAWVLHVAESLPA